MAITDSTYDQYLNNLKDKQLKYDNIKLQLDALSTNPKYLDLKKRVGQTANNSTWILDNGQTVIIGGIDPVSSSQYALLKAQAKSFVDNQETLIANKKTELSSAWEEVKIAKKDLNDYINSSPTIKAQINAAIENEKNIVQNIIEKTKSENFRKNALILVIILVVIIVLFFLYKKYYKKS